MVDFEGMVIPGVPEHLGRYLLERRLAMGGMAEVFLAKQAGPERFERSCIVKRMLAPLAADPQFVEMFLDEARLAAQLSHPNIAPIFDFGQQDGTYYIAMEYVAGMDLRAVIQEHADKGEFIPLPLSIRVCSQAASALDYAHNAVGDDGMPLKIVHRDVSPPNIVVGTSGVVKLIDFGIAKAAGDRHKTTAGVIKGKMAYMSPEQVLGTPLDGRSDLFSLGLVMFELLTNRQAINGETHMDFFEGIVRRPLPSVLEYRNDLPDELVSILYRTMERDQTRRIGSAAELYTELERLLTHLGVTVTPADVARLVTKPGTGTSGPRVIPALNGKHAEQETRPESKTPLGDDGWAPTVASRPPTAPSRPAAAPGERPRVDITPKLDAPPRSSPKRPAPTALPVPKSDPSDVVTLREATLPKKYMQVVQEGPSVAQTITDVDPKS